METEGSRELVRDLDAAGYGLYLLTNAGPRHREYWPRWPVSAWFGDRIFLSSEHGLLKPDPAFYRAALDRFHLDGAACLFVDDDPRNVEGALEAGIGAGIVFHGDTAVLRERMRALGVRV